MRYQDEEIIKPSVSRNEKVLNTLVCLCIEIVQRRGARKLVCFESETGYEFTYTHGGACLVYCTYRIRDYAVKASCELVGY